MSRPGRGLIFRIGAILLILLFVKLLMISVAIFTAGHLKHDAKEINNAGKERMRSFKFSFLITEWLDEEGERKAALKDIIREEIDLFEDKLKSLREGEDGNGKNRYDEPAFISKMIELYPSSKFLLSLPGIHEPELKSQIELINTQWYAKIKPMITAVIDIKGQETSIRALHSLNLELPGFVSEVDRFVSNIEESFERKVNLFRSLQYLFLFLTIVITLIALDHIFLHTKKSVDALMAGIRAITGGTFSKRVVIATKDEMGELAKGFNYMAEKLEESYCDLENKVEEKTAALGERNRELYILYDMVASLKKSLPLNEILHTFLKKLEKHFNIPGGAIRLSEDDGTFKLVVSIGLGATLKGNIPSGECLCGTLVKKDLSCDWNMLFKPKDVSLNDCGDCGYKALIEIPIRYQERTLGIISLFQEEPKEFTAQEKKLFESLNNHLAAAIEYYELNSKTRRLAIMEERNMIANELHDSIAQSLAYLKIQGKLLDESLHSNNTQQALEDISQIRKGIEESNSVVRELLLHFRTKLESESLEAAIEKFLARFSEETGIKTVFDTGETIPVLSPGAEVHVFHIVQEALANARKYAEATEVSVSVQGDGNFGVVIEDNGVGFELDELKRKDSSHVGIDIMRERALRLGGNLSIESGASIGTRVSLSMS